MILTELAPHNAGDGTNLIVNGPPVMLKPQAALFLALVMHELATNAAKYGALSTTGGRVEIAWKIAGGSPAHLELTWAEQGGPKIDGLLKRGFGTEFIERGPRFELQGEAGLKIVNGGLQCRMAIPTDPGRLVFGSPGPPPGIEEAAA